jgi:hypothetical protein
MKSLDSNLPAVYDLLLFLFWNAFAITSITKTIFTMILYCYREGPLTGETHLWMVQYTLRVEATAQTKLPHLLLVLVPGGTPSVRVSYCQTQRDPLATECIVLASQSYYKLQTARLQCIKESCFLISIDVPTTTQSAPVESYSIFRFSTGCRFQVPPITDEKHKSRPCT